MKPFSPFLVQTIHELQELECFDSFALVGGTNLALRFYHRVSVDIDLFSNKPHSVDDFKKIYATLKGRFNHNIVDTTLRNGDNDRKVTMQFFIQNNNESVKVDLIQNVQRINDVEILDGIKMVSVKDVGVLKLKTISQRTNRKDIYDLDRITDDIPLTELFEALKLKNEKFKAYPFQSPLDLQSNSCPSITPESLLTFKHHDLKDSIEVFENNKSWTEAEISWTEKVERFLSHDTTS